MKLHEERLSGETVYKGRVIRLEVDRVRLQNGNETTREVIRHPGGVATLALDAQDNVFFVRQYRYPFGEVMLELPAGKLEPGEDPAVCAAREFEEETGYRAGSVEFLAKLYPSPGYLDEILYVYLARDLTATAQHLDPDEFLTVERIPLDEAVAMCLRGDIRDGKTVLGLLQHHCRQRGE